jgi:hypothetical protein
MAAPPKVRLRDLFLGKALLPHVGSPGLTRPFCQLIIGGPDVVAVVISGGGTELE